MHIVIVGAKNSAKLATILTSAGHQVTRASAVNKIRRREMEILTPRAKDFESLDFNQIDLAFCVPFDARVYCGDRFGPNHVFDGMAELERTTCGIAPTRGQTREQLGWAGFTSFVTQAELKQLTRRTVPALLTRLAKDATGSIAKYNRKDEVVRRRRREEEALELARSESAKLSAAYDMPPNMRTTDQYYRVLADRAHLDHLYTQVR